MPEYLKLWLTYKDRKVQKKIKIQGEEIANKMMTIRANTILRHIKNVLYEEGSSVQTFLRIWVDIKGSRENLFKLKKRNTDIRLTLTEQDDDRYFQINVVITEGSLKNNIIRNYQLIEDNYLRLKSSMEKVIAESKQEEKKGQEQRPIDIAYFFADPLVSVKKSNDKIRITPENQVSFQVQYDQFISMVKKEELRLNFRIEMMVATETNITKTLLEGASILHFACHGTRSGSLEIEHEKQIGEKANLSSHRLMDILDNKTLPRAIIFNVCHSYKLAQKISALKNIMTIGYDGFANDRVCEAFTKQFYIGIFRDGKSIRQVFHEIKDNITKDKPEEGKKLHIFPEEKHPLEVMRLTESKPSSKEFVIRWSMLQSLRGNDTLGVKKQMYRLINESLINNERMSYVFLEGDKNSGKTSLINKLRIYVLNRKVFTDEFYFDLKKEDGEPMETMLELKLALEIPFLAWRNEMKNKAKEGRVACLIVLDHAQRVMMYQYAELTKYIEHEMKDRLTYGKIIVVTRKLEPFSQREAELYSKAYRISKEPCYIEKDEFNNFVSRYWQPYLKQAQRLNTQKKQPFIAIVKGIKRSERVEELEKNVVELNKPLPPSEPQEIPEEEEVEKDLEKVRQETERILRDIEIEIAENHHIYISTIFQEIADRTHKSSKPYLRPQSSREGKKEDLCKLVASFKKLYERTILYQHEQATQLFKQFARESLKIAGLCYLLNVCFEEHMMNCDKMYIMANTILLSSFISEPLRVSRKESQGEGVSMILEIEGIQLDELLKQYKLKVLLTLYTYYSESQFKLLESIHVSEESMQSFEEKGRKAEIVLSELLIAVKKRSNEHEIEIKESFLKKYIAINKMIQEILYSPQFHQLKDPKVVPYRKNSDLFNTSDNDSSSIALCSSQIHKGHKKIEQYWRLYEELLDNNRSFNILSNDSLVIMELGLIRLINFNQLYFQHLESRGENNIKRDMQAYLQLYITIMQAIEQSQIFCPDTKSHSEYVVWKYPKCQSIKKIFRHYFKKFIDVYFHIEKLNQNITKNYDIKIFNQLLQLTTRHEKVELLALKKEIETHKEEQFLSNYSCETHLALPLLKPYNSHQRINLKRYENHIFQFQEKFFSTLDREIKNDIFSLNKEFFTQEQSSKSLIQLLVVNCSDTNVECEDSSGKAEPLKIKDITRVPKAPVIILFGCNVKSLIDTFRELNTCSVLITIDLGFEEHPSEKELMEKNVVRQPKNLKEARIKKLEDYSHRLEICYTILEFFYTSFCRHFFSVDHGLFLQQVNSSYHLAKAETLMKTRIRLETGPSSQYSKFIRESIDRIEIWTSKSTLQQIGEKPAYHFMFRHYKVQNFARIICGLTKPDHEKREIQGQIGCNRQIYELLEGIQRTRMSENYILVYKSKEMLEYFLKTLVVKLIKYKKYEVVEVDSDVPESLDLSKASSMWSLRPDPENEDNENNETTKVMLFSKGGLTEEEIQEEIDSIPKNEQTTLRLFFTNQRYKSLSNCYQIGIQETYNHQKIEFQLFMIDCKSNKPLSIHKDCMKAFLKLTDHDSFSLSQIKREIQKKHG